MSTATRGASILIVDDTVENLRLLSSMLASQGYDVRPVRSGPQALQAAESSPPDLILLDINMPDVDGYEVCARLKRSEELRDIPVIFLTALSQAADKVKAFEVGGADYITKPFQIDEVLARVKVHVELRQANVRLVEQYDRLRRLERMRDELVHMIVHDMRSPLTALSFLVEFAKSRVDELGEQEASEELRAAADTVARLSRMANDLLDVSRLEEGKLPIDKAPHDLGAIAREVVGLVGRLDPKRPITIAGDDAAVATCDRTLIRRVLENLISNAIKHTPPGQPVEVTVRAGATVVRVEVRDHGAGIPDAMKAQIFEKFGAVDARKGNAFHSAGLGLAFCRMVVSAHGGHIGVEDAVPRGSTFFLELPR